MPSELFTLVATKGIDGRGIDGGRSSGSVTVSSKASNTSAGSGDAGGASSFGAIAHATRTTHPATAAIEAWEVSEVLDLSDGGEPASPLPWRTLPGLFAGGKLDVMTAVLLRALPPVPSTVREHECSSHLCCGLRSHAHLTPITLYLRVSSCYTLFGALFTGACARLLLRRRLHRRCPPRPPRRLLTEAAPARRRRARHPRRAQEREQGSPLALRQLGAGDASNVRNVCNVRGAHHWFSDS